MFNRWLLSLLLCSSSAVHAAITVTGDSDAASGETFSFRVQEAAMSVLSDSVGTNLYVAAHPSDGGSDTVKDFAVSRVSRSTNSFLPLTPQTTTFNFNTEVTNPLYDQGIAYMKLFNAEESILAGSKERPIVVLENDKTTLYMINNFTDSGKNISVLSFQKTDVTNNVLITTQNVPDATGAVTSGIVQIAAGYPYVFAAVGANGGSFGASGSGVAFGIIGQSGSFTGPLLLDAPTGMIGYSAGNRAAALDITSDQIKIGSNLASLGTIVDMVWHRSIDRCYIALQATGGAAGTDGARSIAIGRVNVIPTVKEVTDSSGKKREETSYTYQLVIEPIAPAAAIDGTNKIIGAVGSSVAVTAHKVREMFTSTALPYLIVQGNVGAPSATKKTVFALPLVSGNENVSLNGTIAAKDAATTDHFNQLNRFAARTIQDAATTTAQMPLSTDAATQVGGGALLNGDISNLFVLEDTVFAAVQTADAGQVPGVFYSQAMFAQDGKIKGWTTWRRAVGLADRDYSLFLDQVTGQFYTLVANASSQVKTVKRTEWTQGDPDSIFPLTQITNAYFSKEQAGVQGLHDFVITSGALGTQTPGLLDISLLVATGYKKVMLAQTSRIVAGAVIPIQDGDFGPLTAFNAGEITTTFPTSGSRVVGISGGVLDDIGPLVAAEIAQDGTAGSNGWLFVGGNNGVAVLSKADGSGWNTVSGLSDGLLGLTAGMSFKKVGDYSQVRKLIYDDQYLYIIMQEEIVRIDLTLETPGLGSVSATTIATTAGIGAIGSEGTFLDAIVSEKLMVFGTSAGLFRLSNGLDARTVDANSASWQRLETPEGVGPVRQLFAITQTGRMQDSARASAGGMFYALSAYRGKQQAQLHRFDVAQVTSGSIGNNTVTRIADLYMSDIPSYFASFGVFKNVFATDGTLFYGTQSKIPGVDAQVTQLLSRDATIHTGSNFVSNVVIPVAFNGTLLITGMIQNSATGTWLIAGDHGLRANE